MNTEDLQAYKMGYIAGFLNGADELHRLWATKAKETKGIGPKLHAALLEKMTEYLTSRRNNVAKLDIGCLEDLLAFVPDGNITSVQRCMKCDGVLQVHEDILMCSICFTIYPKEAYQNEFQTH